MPKRRVQIMIDPDLYKKTQHLAIEENKSYSEIIAEALEVYFEQKSHNLTASCPVKISHR